jgi:hypothetical protein
LGKVELGKMGYMALGHILSTLISQIFDDFQSLNQLVKMKYQIPGDEVITQNADMHARPRKRTPKSKSSPTEYNKNAY